MLEIGNVYLRELRSEDRNEYFNWINDRKLVNFNSSFRPVSWSEHCQWFESIASQNETHIFSIISKKDDVLIGSCSLRNIFQQAKNAELQIRIGVQYYRNKGYGTSAIKLLLQFGFLDLNLKRIYLNVFSNNLAAIKSYEKVGFIKEGLKRKAVFIEGKYLDVLMMSILDSEYF